MKIRPYTKHFLILSLYARHIDGWSCDTEGTRLAKSEPLTSVDHLAITNDASPAYYYKSVGIETDKVVVMLGSGGQCWNAASCLKRNNGSASPYEVCESTDCLLMSSKHYPDECKKRGIFDRSLSKNPFQNWTMVYVPYSSSDAFMGNASFAGFEFRGRAIVFAALRHIITTEQSRLVFGGESAGARGAMVWLDEIAVMLSPLRVQGLLDSPLYLDIEGSPLVPISKKAFDSFNIGVHKHSWTDIFGEYTLPRIQTPFFIVASQFDSYQLSQALFHSDSIIDIEMQSSLDLTVNQYHWALLFANRTRAVLSDSIASKYNGIFSIACWSHAPTLNAEQLNQQIALDNSALLDVMTSYFSSSPGKNENILGSTTIIDQCHEFLCGTCSDISWSILEHSSPTLAPSTIPVNEFTLLEDESLSLRRNPAIALAADIVLGISIILLVIALALMAIAAPHGECFPPKYQESTASYTPIYTANNALVEGGESHLELGTRATRAGSLASEEDFQHPSSDDQIGIIPISSLSSQESLDDIDPDEITAL
eukprot:CAMPEP_0197318564 /NCGR_PEP_ID=MMETSP0891-20130614/51609_1 /TAXON_ID=44058 ORGANISM="Aureoumbra lagunensis, Strain CCMP1510" /NCGR_SAMPLE_ID=MMETSP0891 /ASSEMBLY_ACC=CAM_ASM_000534 /LENGTH=538 /DNA_ID=CAMNT_0042809099 /DNA_START=27 /DNA_END=1643 /DNA_ORIENTATION=-